MGYHDLSHDADYRFKNSSTALTWDAAQDQAEFDGGNLASVFDSSYQDQIESFLSEYGASFVWIGGRVEYVNNPRTWRWRNGEFISLF